ncbi:hypothetical protein ElyMa_002693800 [Elysia marginata]|uniref:Uncharacterized protein n=1 Tax=Elysia marginata TaxID=1093978 RepID=A0AAV4HFR4_9GAST|nr:hypothetical protein ElyMa_002693800 [Elysia marginata]
MSPLSTMPRRMRTLFMAALCYKKRAIFMIMVSFSRFSRDGHKSSAANDVHDDDDYSDDEGDDDDDDELMMMIHGHWDENINAL